MSKNFLIGLFAITALAFGIPAEATREQVVCKLLFNKLSATNIPATTSTASQIQRIDTVLKYLTAQERKELFANLAEQDLPAMARNIRAGKIEGYETLFKQQPELTNLLIDLVEFGDTFPGIFAGSDPENSIRRIVDLVRQEEVNIKTNNPDILKAQAEAPRLRRTLDNNIINLIEQANSEYGGMKHGRSGMDLLLYRLRRFFQPHYRQVRDLTDWTIGMEKQLQKLKAIDALIIRTGLSEAHSLGLTDAEINTLLKFVLNSPGEIRDIENAAKVVFGNEFSIGREMEIGKFDIYASHKDMRGINTEKIYDSFDKINVESLDSVNEVLNTSRLRKGQAPRTPKEYDSFEVQARFEAAERQSRRSHQKYGAFTDQDSNVSYKIEHEHKTQVPDGKDEQGNIKYKDGPSYYTEETITPSFEDIFTGNYRSGDRHQIGLSELKNDAARMVNRETPTRSLSRRVHEFTADLSANWKNKVFGKAEINQPKEEAEKLLKTVDTEIEKQEAYAKWSKQEILRQYSDDNVENFQGRNLWMLNNLKQQKAELEMLAEALRRTLPDVHPFYDLIEYDQWLDNLRKHRNIARGMQAGMGVVGAAGATVGLSQDARDYLEDKGIPLNDWIHNGADYVNSFRSR